MTALFMLAKEYRETALALADLDLDAQTVADTLEGIGGELEQKAQNVALMVRSLESDAAACKEWAKTATEQARAIQNRADRLREYLANAMQSCNKTKISGPGISMSFRASHAVFVDDPDLIPKTYMRQPETPPPEPDKAAMLAAMRLGEVVPGAHIETRKSLQIK